MTPNIESLESVVSQTAEVETNAESIEQLEISEAPAPITPQEAPNKEPVPWGTFLRKATTEAI